MIETLPQLSNLIDKQSIQVYLENYFDKKNIRKLLRSRFEEYFSTLDIPEFQNTLVYDIMGILCIRTKRTSINAIIEMLAERLNVEASAHEIMDCIILLLLHDIITGYQDSKGRLYVEWDKTLSDKDLDLIHQYQFKLPMIVKPLPLNRKGNNRGCGYYLNGSSSLVLNQPNMVDDIDHKVLERFNAIPLSLNISLMKNLENSWKSQDDPRTLKEQEEYDVNFERFNRAVAKASAIMINYGNEFYFCHKYDKRGRIYCLGYQLSYQGASFAKAQIEFKNKSVITDEVVFF